MFERIVGWPWEESLAVVFAGAWGGMLGSFLNVLAHRIPLGRTPVTGRSSCPRCGAPVRFRDNVPVIGWLVLRGRCRDCRGPIPVSYLVVETGCAAAAATLAAAGLAAGGAEAVERGDLAPVGRWALQLAAVITVVARSLLAFDVGSRAARESDEPSRPRPWSTLVPLLVAWGVAWASPGCGPAAWPEAWPWPRAAVLRSVAAAAAGSLAGWAAGILRPRSFRGSLAILGSVLGWQGVTVVTVLTVAAGAAAGRLRDPRTLGILAAACATAVAAGTTLLRDG